MRRRAFTDGFRQPKRGLWRLEWMTFWPGLPQAPQFRIPWKQFGIAALFIGLGHFLPWDWAALYFLPFVGMAQQTLNATAGGPDDNLPTATAKLNSMFGELYAFQSSTLNAADPRFAGATDEISINNAINMPVIGAIAVGADRVFIPTSMLPFDATQVSSNTAVRQVREGADHSVFDLRAYGAAGLGGNDTAALAAALAGAGAASGVLYGPPGIYGYTLALLPPSNITMRGIRGATTFKLLDNSNALLLQAIGKSNLRIEGITWDAGTQSGINTTSLQFDGCTDIDVTYCTFLNAKIPIWLRGVSGACQRITIDRNIFNTVTDHAVRANEATFGSGLTIDNNTVTNVLQGVVVSPAAFAVVGTRTKIRGNSVLASDDSGVIAAGAVTDIEVSGNTIHSTKVAVFIGTGAKRARIFGNDLSSDTDFGLDFEGAGAVSEELSVCGNTIHDCGRSGINIQDVNRVTVTGNTIARVGTNTGMADNQRCGISVVVVNNPSVKWVTITANVIFDNAGSPTMRYGILVQPMNDYLFIRDNSVQNGIVRNYGINPTGQTVVEVVVNSSPSVDRGDASITLTAGTDDNELQLFNTALTLARTVTLSTASVWNGARFRILRTAAATGASTLTVGGKALSAGQQVEFNYSTALSAWVETAFTGL